MSHGVRLYHVTCSYNEVLYLFSVAVLVYEIIMWTVRIIAGTKSRKITNVRIEDIENEINLKKKGKYLALVGELNSLKICKRQLYTSLLVGLELRLQFCRKIKAI